MVNAESVCHSPLVRSGLLDISCKTNDSRASLADEALPNCAQLIALPAQGHAASSAPPAAGGGDAVAAWRRGRAGLFKLGGAHLAGRGRQWAGRRQTVSEIRTLSDSSLIEGTKHQLIEH